MTFRAISISAMLLLSGWGGLSLQKAPGQQPLTGFPFQDETLQFSVKWPTGVSLGQAHTQARRIADGRWEFEFSLDASIPGVIITDRYKSVATADLCSVEFERDSVHGLKRRRDKVVFEQDRNSVRRTTTGGGSGDFAVPSCAKDALTFLYFTRREMGQGRVPAATTIVLGGPYDIQLEYKGQDGAASDRVASSVRGPSSNTSFDVVFARDPARTPSRMTVPLPLGSFSLQLAR